MSSAERERLQKARANPANSPALVAYIDRMLAGLPLEQTGPAADNGAGTTRKPPSPKKKSPATTTAAKPKPMPPPWLPFQSPFPTPHHILPVESGMVRPEESTTAAKRQWHIQQMDRAERALSFHERELVNLRRRPG